MRILLAAAIGLATATTAYAGDNGGRCSPKHLAGTWLATFEVVVDETTDADVSCLFTLGRDGAVAESSCNVDIIDEATAFPVTGSIQTTRSCGVTGSLSFADEALTLDVDIQGQLTRDRDLFVGAILGETWLKPVTAVRMGKIKAKKSR